MSVSESEDGECHEMEAWNLKCPQPCGRQLSFEGQRIKSKGYSMDECSPRTKALES